MLSSTRLAAARRRGPAFGKRNSRRLRLPLCALALLAGVSAVTVGGASPAAAAIGTIKYGSSGDDVAIWQRDLNAFIGTYHTCRPTLTVDGDFGTKTDAATRCFQRLEGDGDDGIVGPVTRTDMCNFLDVYGFDTLYEFTCD